VKFTRVFIALLVVAGIVPTVALAHRRATKGERTAVLTAVVKQHQLSKAQASCQTVTISTVNQSYAGIPCESATEVGFRPAQQCFTSS
jgi:hypothetical protein